MLKISASYSHMNIRAKGISFGRRSRGQQVLLFRSNHVFALPVNPCTKTRLANLLEFSPPMMDLYHGTYSTLASSASHIL